jgi:hypothetical protein
MHYINYKESQLPFCVDFKVIKNVCAKLQIKLTQFEQAIDNPEQTEIICFEGLKRGHSIDSKEFNLKETDVEEILSESYGQFLKAFSEDVLRMFTIQDKKK